MNLNATLFFQMIVFFVLGWFTMKFIWPPMTKAIDDRRQKIADGLAAAEKGKADLAQAQRLGIDLAVLVQRVVPGRAGSGEKRRIPQSDCPNR